MPALSVEAALAVESMAYGLLQAGPEFQRWLAARRPVTARPSAEPVRLERDRGMLTITLDRPAVHNAYDAATRDALIDALEVLRLDPTLTAAHLRGAGRSFCSGGDLSELGLLDDPVTAHQVRAQRSAAARRRPRRRAPHGPSPRRLRRRGHRAGGVRRARHRARRHEHPSPRGRHGPDPRRGRHRRACRPASGVSARRGWRSPARRSTRRRRCAGASPTSARPPDHFTSARSRPASTSRRRSLPVSVWGSSTGARRVRSGVLEPRSCRASPRSSPR